MEIGEKLKNFRTLRHLSQEQLAAQSGISVSTIAKYESGLRKPKPDQLTKLAEALGISVNAFLDFNIKTVSDLLSLLFKMDEQLDVEINAEQDEHGKYIPETVSLTFTNSTVNSKLCSYISAKAKREALLSSAPDTTDPAVISELQQLDQSFSDLTVGLLDDSTVILKDITPQSKSPIPSDQEVTSNAHKELQELFADCSPSELNFMLRMVNYMKKSLREENVDFLK